MMFRAACMLVALAIAVPGPGAAQDVPISCEQISSARYVEPTIRYPHGALGDDSEWGGLEVRLSGAGTCPGGARLQVKLPEALVFEDVAPRLVDVTGDGAPEIVVVESHQNLGARLAIWGIDAGTFTRLVATPHIGTRFRWLAPVGVGDLDGDGKVELAYVDRPHLAKTLRVWRYDAGALSQVASLGGLSNHRIGDREISGGLRDCGSGTEMVTASGDWTRLVSTRLEAGRLRARDIGPNTGERAFRAAMACR
ncbi:VCBS repeat protein [Aliiruegeria haliotis]|uniref:VCBS repeat protein n=1 Tax=Aliiruegeria haliotis TaxID=1280846 RepID=A0A2T0RR56_9RHOB|nr:VCBS repeat-containing protein [Aliiruegeria haliotis]PRY23685.1 VCBS repeat protein [Aliiruegeria haliotis]